VLNIKVTQESTQFDLEGNDQLTILINNKETIIQPNTITTV